MNTIRLLAFSLIALATLSLVWAQYPPSAPASGSAEDSLYSVIGVGDIMLGTNYPKASYLPANQGKGMLSKVGNVLQDAHCTFGNLEGILLDSGGQMKECDDPSLCYYFRMPQYMGHRLKDAGFDLLSLANNHQNDFGREGQDSTVAILNRLGIKHAGLTHQPTFTIYENQGVKYGMCAFSPIRNTYDLDDFELVAETVEELSKRCDITILSFHGGNEGSKHRHTPWDTTEMQWDFSHGNVTKLARVAIDHGADIVFGHGPHVLRAMDRYKDRIIFYSLGNFATYARMNIRSWGGIGVIAKVFVRPDGSFHHAKLFPTKQIGRGYPIIDKTGKAIRGMKSLTRADFPKAKLEFVEGGEVR